MSKHRKHYTPEEKVSIIRRHLIEKIPVSDPCREQKLQPTVFYPATAGLKEFFENGAAAFWTQYDREREHDKERIAALEEKLKAMNEVLSELMEEHVALKKSWGDLMGIWVPPDTRDAVIDFVNRWSKKTEISVAQFIPWLAISASKFYRWSTRYGKVNEHNGWIPRDFWLEDWEKQAIIAFHLEHPLEGYRRLTFMMLDRDVVAVSPTSAWRALSDAGLLQRWSVKPSKKGSGFAHPLRPHEHWHVYVSYLNLCGTF